MLPRMVSHPIEPLTLTYFTILAASLGPGSVSAFNFASDYQVLPVSLIGVAVLAGGLPGPVGGLRGRRRPDVSGGARPEPPDDRRAHRPRRRRPVRLVGDPGRRAARWRTLRPRGRRADVGRRRRVRAVDPVRRARLPAVPRACTRRTTRSARSSPRSPGSGWSSWPRRRSSGRSGSWPSRSATRPAWPPRTRCWRSSSSARLRRDRATATLRRAERRHDRDVQAVAVLVLALRAAST